MARITVEDCIDKFESRFELVLVASNRARKLHSGENPTVEKDNDKNTVIALREIADESIAIDDMKNNLIEEYQTVSLQSEEDLTIENIDSQDSSSDGEVEDEVEDKVKVEVEDEVKVEDEDEVKVKVDSLEVDSNDSSESTIGEISYKQDDPDENNEEFSTETGKPTED